MIDDYVMFAIKCTEKMSYKILLLFSPECLTVYQQRIFFLSKIFVNVFHLRPECHDIVMLYWHNSNTPTMICNLFQKCIIQF